MSTLVLAAWHGRFRLGHHRNLQLPQVRWHLQVEPSRGVSRFARKAPILKARSILAKAVAHQLHLNPHHGDIAFANWDPKRGRRSIENQGFLAFDLVLDDKRQALNRLKRGFAPEFLQPHLADSCLCLGSALLFGQPGHLLKGVQIQIPNERAGTCSGDRCYRRRWHEPNIAHLRVVGNVNDTAFFFADQILGENSLFLG